jgi:RNA polymerase primary sigma factor
MLNGLTEREQKIIKLRFGLEDGKNYTLEEVGQEFSVTRERIRQIEAKALAKLRKHKDAKKLYEYIK